MRWMLRTGQDVLKTGNWRGAQYTGRRSLKGDKYVIVQQDSTPSPPPPSKIIIKKSSPCPSPPPPSKVTQSLPALLMTASAVARGGYHVCLAQTTCHLHCWLYALTLQISRLQTLLLQEALAMWHCKTMPVFMTFSACAHLTGEHSICLCTTEAALLFACLIAVAPSKYMYLGGEQLHLWLSAGQELSLVTGHGPWYGRP